MSVAAPDPRDARIAALEALLGEVLGCPQAAPWLARMDDLYERIRQALGEPASDPPGSPMRSARKRGGRPRS